MTLPPAAGDPASCDANLAAAPHGYRGIRQKFGTERIFAQIYSRRCRKDTVSGAESAAVPGEQQLEITIPL
jgi:hypothetical protein